MFNDKMVELGNKRSTIRELFEYGKNLAKEKGQDAVFDFSLGNPSVPCPKEVNDAIVNLLSTSNSVSLHGYTSAQGNESTRQKVAQSLEKRGTKKVNKDLIYMTCGAAASLTISLKALVSSSDDEVIIFKPYFPEYKVFISNADAKVVEVDFDENDFMPCLKDYENKITKTTKAVIINSPNNPSGVIYKEDVIQHLCDILKKKEDEYQHPIFIISDEPYRELVYDNEKVVSIFDYYKDSIICYSYSKSLSLPGERIGYIAVNEEAFDASRLYYAICGAGRSQGYVCAPSLFQKVVEIAMDARPDLEQYKKNRDLLYSELTKIGYNCIYPDGAFYLFVKALEKDAESFSNKAKELGLLLVPGDSFGARGFVRIAYCVDYDMIKRSIPLFDELYKKYE